MALDEVAARKRDDVYKGGGRAPRFSLSRVPSSAVCTGLIVLAAASAAALEHPLRGGQRASLSVSQEPRASSIRFVGDAVLSGASDPRCPASSSVRLLLRDEPSAPIELDCRKWRRFAQGYRYLDPSDPPSGIRKIVLASDRLSIYFTQRSPSPVSEVPFVELALTIGDDSYCGRFSAPAIERAGMLIASGPTAHCRLPRPNLILIVLDDVRADGIDRMPTLLNRVAGEGMSFDNAFTPDSSCAPSRASILTGLYALRHRTVQVAGSIGGARRFRELNADKQTIALWLQTAGYRTGLFGKYLNAYSGSEQTHGPNGAFYIPPGWDRWWAFVSPEHYGGVHGTSYRIVEEDGRISTFAEHSSDSQYSTDLSAQQLRAFVSDAVKRGQPFFAYWAPYAGHAETPDMVPVPAERHAGRFDDLPKWRPESWDEADVSDKPRWVQVIQSRIAKHWEAKLSRIVTEQNRRQQYESLLAADEQIGLLLDQLTDLGIDRDTVVLVVSDNGLGWGEHQVWGEKGCPYEACQRVPLIVRYPRRVAGGGRHVTRAALNLDLAPTLAALGGASDRIAEDGADLTDWLIDSPPPTWRSDYMLEYWRLNQGDTLRYTDQVADGDRLRLYYAGARQQPRPSVVFEFDADGAVTPGAVAVPIGVNADETFSALATAVRESIRDVRVVFDAQTHTVGVARPSANEYWSLYFWTEVDQKGAFEPAYELPSYVGVRDVDGGFTWVEYETGERELYDLNVDPNELDNRAKDPAYASVRERLERRLKEMIQGIRSR